MVVVMVVMTCPRECYLLVLFCFLLVAAGLLRKARHEAMLCRPWEALPCEGLYLSPVKLKLTIGYVFN